MKPITFLHLTRSSRNEFINELILHLWINITGLIPDFAWQRLIQPFNYRLLSLLTQTLTNVTFFTKFTRASRVIFLSFLFHQFCLFDVCNAQSKAVDDVAPVAPDQLN